ncbi:MAG: transcription termination factor NusA, partial [Chloroflexota bacterium]|nr:transcription termination factor NusA [Chloroflexota bacterium]
MSRDFIGALLQLNAEKGVPREQLIRTVEDAIQSAYRRVAPGYEDVFVSLDTETGEMRIYRARLVVSEVEDEATEWAIADAQKHDAKAVLGDLVEYEQLEPTHFGRVGAQVAGQVVRQRLREAERETLFDEFAHREGEIITGSVGRVEPSGVILDLGKAEAILRTTDQSATEHYRIGQHVKTYVLEVRRTTRGPLIYVSRTHKNFLRRLFELEVPEIQAGTVEIRAIAREAGSRSKMAVASRQEGLDPVGATVGQRGGRVQAVVAELGGEKIDVIPWSDDPDVFVANALSPADVVGVEIDEDERIASVTVPERMLSLAIGREGQNARLAAKLTGWRIDIRSDAVEAEPAQAPEPKPKTEAEPEAKEAPETQAEPETSDAPTAEPEAEKMPEAPAEPEAEKAPEAKPKTKT